MSVTNIEYKMIDKSLKYLSKRCDSGIKLYWILKGRNVHFMTNFSTTYCVLSVDKIMEKMSELELGVLE